MRIDQPADPAGDVAREGDPVPDEPVLEHPAPVAGDAEPAEPRTRHEHADPPVSAGEPSQPSEESPPDAPNEPPEESPPDERDSPNSDRRASPDDSPANREASDNQEELPEREASAPTVDDESTQPDDAPGPPPDPEPTQKPDGPDDEDSLQPTGDAISSADRNRPLTDKEWAEHLTEVRDGLAQARREGLETHLLYTIDPDHQSWSKDRRGLHHSIINDIYSVAHDIPSQGRAIIAGGLGGSGKTTVLTEQAGIDRSQYLIINPDDLKEEMARRDMIPHVEGLSPMEASDLVHEESSYLARQLALRAHVDKKNLIWDITMSTEEKTVRRIEELRAAGYTQVDGLFVEIPIATSINRTDSRHREGHDLYCTGQGLGGRYVPPEVISRQEDVEWGSKNKKTFEAVKERLNDWSVYDNSVDGRRSVLVESSRSSHAG